MQKECDELLEATRELDCNENELDRKVDEMALRALYSNAHNSLIKQELNIKHNLLG